MLCTTTAVVKLVMQQFTARLTANKRNALEVSNACVTFNRDSVYGPKCINTEFRDFRLVI